MSAEGIHRVDVNVATGTDVSDVVNLRGRRIIAIETPALLTSTSISFQAGNAPEAAGLKPVHDKAGSLYSLTVAISRRTEVPFADLGGFEHVRLKMASSETPARILTILSRAEK